MELENRAWDALLERRGEWGMWELILHTEGFRAYYRHWPYDDTEKAFNLHGGDYYDEWASGEADRIAAEYDFSLKLEPLTPRQRQIAELVAAGLKPRDIARELGEPDTNAIRWTKWSLKNLWRVNDESKSGKQRFS